MTVEEMKQELVRLSAEAQQIQQAADQHGRPLTASERVAVDASLNRFEDLTADVKRKERIDSASNVLNAPQPRKTGPGSITNSATPEIKAFGDFVRSGARITNATSMTVGGTDDGAGLVPSIVSNQIREVQASQGAIRRLSTVMAVSQPVEIPIATSLPGAQYRVEGDAREDQVVPVVKTATLPGGALSSVITVSTFLANDSAWPMESWISSAIGRSFGVTESESFVNGTGTLGESKGILAYTQAATADSSRAWGTLEKLHSGSSGAGLTPDFLLQLSIRLAPAYRANASFVMHPATYSTLLQTKAATSGAYLLDGAASATGLPSAWGLPIHLDVNVPVAGASSASILCGDFKAGYLIQDVGPMSCVRDPYTSKGNIKIWCESRLYAGVVDSNAIKVGVLAA
jgi:HK97 family phage major capsid protein